MTLVSIPSLTEVLLPVRPLCQLLIEWIDRGISRPGSRRYLWGQSTRMCCSDRGCCTGSSRFGLEHPRPYALGCHCLPGPPAREPADYREGKSNPGKTSLVREPVAGKATRCSCYRSWPRAIYASGKVG